MEPEKRRSLLLQAALQVFALHGLQRARHTHVAENANVSLSTVFAYFPSHKDLVAAVLAEVAQAYVELARELKSLPGNVAVAHFLHSVASMVAVQPAHARILYSWSRAVQEPNWALFIRLHEEMASLLACTIERGILEGSIDKEVHSERSAEVLLGRANMLLQLLLTGDMPTKLRDELLDPVHSFVS